MATSAEQLEKGQISNPRSVQWKCVENLCSRSWDHGWEVGPLKRKKI